MATSPLPDDLAASIAGQDSATTSTLLAIHRTGLADLRSHLANERTHLAWLRTAISLVGFGITINRFSVFLQEKGKLETGHAETMLRSSEHAGGGMVLIGLVVMAWALYRYWQVAKDITHARLRPMHGAILSLTIFLLIGGGFTAAWLFLKAAV
jgi:putative membrane protein